MIGAINEFERSNMLERQREGIAIAKNKGMYKGRKQIEKPDNWKEIYLMWKNRELTANKAMDLLSLKRNTFYKFVGEEVDLEHTDSLAKKILRLANEYDPKNDPAIKAFKQRIKNIER